MANLTFIGYWVSSDGGVFSIAWILSPIIMTWQLLHNISHYDYSGDNFNVWTIYVTTLGWEMRSTIVLNKPSKDIEEALWLRTLKSLWSSHKSVPYTRRDLAVYWEISLSPVHLLVCLWSQRDSLGCWGVSDCLTCPDKPVPLSGSSRGSCIRLVASSSQ